MKYQVAVFAPDGTHRHNYKSAAGAIKHAEAQLGRTLAEQHAYENDYVAGYVAPDFPAALAAGGYFRFTCDWGRQVVVAGKS